MAIGVMDSRKRKMNGSSNFNKKGPASRGDRGRGRGRGSRSTSSGRKFLKANDDSSGFSRSQKRSREDDEEILSEGSDQEFEDEQITLRRDEETDDETQETEQEKRLRLTKDYLRQMEESTTTDKSVSDRLREDILEASGRLHRTVAKNFSGYNAAATKIFRGHSGHKLSVTCVSSNGLFVFSGGKEGTLIKWDADSGKALKKIVSDATEALGHNGSILCLSISSDSKFIASGGTDKLIKIWLVDSMDLFMNFKGHRDAVSGVAFRVNAHQLFSCSHDRNVKVWNVDEKAYVETLFGHQNAITAIDSFHKERCITSGGQDFSVRIWKILEESQLVFQLPAGSLECISLIDDDHFVTGNDEGSLCLWGTNKKKPMWTVRNAHKSETGEVHWITAVDSLKNTDMFASGSNSGEIIVWAIQEGFRAVTMQFKIPTAGFINSLKFILDGLSLVAGVGQEHRLGRWWRIKEAKNSVQVFSLTQTLQESEV